MRIAIQQTALGDISLTKCFARARRVGAEGIGLCYRTQQQARHLGDPQHVARLLSLCDRFNMPVVGVHLGVLCTDQYLIEQSLLVQGQDLVGRAVAMAAELGRPDVIVPFLGRNRIELADEFDIAGSAIAEVAERAEDHGVVLAIESTMHLNQLQPFVARCGSDYVKVCLDTGDITACRHDPGSVIRGLGRDNIAQVHIKDVRVVSGLAPDFNVRLGHGHVNFRSVSTALDCVGYGGWLVLETPPGDDRGAIAAAHMAFVRKAFQIPQSSPAQKGVA